MYDFEDDHVMRPTTALWQRLRQARRYADLSQQDLATRCSVSRGAVALWESAEPEHRTKPTVDHLVAVAKATRVPLEWLMNDTSDINAIWRIKGEFSGEKPADAIPDMRHGNRVFMFAQTPEQIAAKLRQIQDLAPDTEGHLVLIGPRATVHTAATPADALSAVVRVLTQNP